MRYIIYVISMATLLATLILLSKLLLMFRLMLSLVAEILNMSVFLLKRASIFNSNI